jgi:hypothetical protein
LCCGRGPLPYDSRHAELRSPLRWDCSGGSRARNGTGSRATTTSGPATTVSGAGRWLGVDPVLGEMTNPQRLNRCAYVLNDPVNYVDRDGMFEIPAHLGLFEHIWNVYVAPYLRSVVPGGGGGARETGRGGAGVPVPTPQTENAEAVNDEETEST